ncbi:MAG: peptide ABC transporter substrate-binding protein [Rhodospirillales bacterium]|nr:MAG: peptide ABC transporter substrate-binding protein [Rhodospirillales bacterium]
MPTRRWLLFLAVALAVAGLAPEPAAGRDELVIGVTQYPYTFHPNMEPAVAKSYVLGFTRRPITVYDADWELVCMLCETPPTIDNGLAVPETTPDGAPGIAVTFTLRADAVWGDGTPITTRDVLFTWEAGRHPRSGIIPKEFYRSLYAIDVADDRTFTLRFDRLTFAYNAVNSFDLLPAHIEAPAFADPEDYRRLTRFDADTTNPGLYSGPYLVSEAVSGSHVVLTRNPQWWGKPPAFRRIVIRTIENTAALEANLLSGAIHMVAGELGLTLDQAIAFERRHGDRFVILYRPGLAYEHVDLNLDNPVLADARVRRALLHAIDREAINSELFAGRQPVALSNVNPLDWVFTEDVPHYPYDPAEAARLLDEAGFADRRRGMRRDQDGRPLSLEIMTTAGNRSRELVQQVLVSQWRDAGIEVRIRNEPSRVFFGQTVSQRRFSAMAMFAWISSPESVPRTTLHSEQIPTPENNWAGQNYTGFRNAEMDRLIEAIEVELDRDRREALWHQLQRLYATELPALPLFFRADSFILPRWLEGVVPTGHQYPTSLWVEDWRVAEGR